MEADTSPRGEVAHGGSPEAGPGGELRGQGFPKAV